MSNLNQSHTDPSNAEDQWAKEALKSTLDICFLNERLVSAGLFPTYIQAMTSSAELLQFKRFLDRLLLGRQALLKAG